MSRVLRLPAALSGIVWLSAVSAAPAAPTTGPTPAGPTPAVSSSPQASHCGNGLLEEGETCDGCPADCRPVACKSDARRKVTVSLTPQPGFERVGAVTVLLGYRQGVLALPGEKDEAAVAARVVARTPGSQVFVNDLGAALRIVVSNNDGLPEGPLVDVELDRCGDAAAPQRADLSCRVESCAKGGARLRLCTCAAALP